MARLSDPFQEELNGLPLEDPQPLGLASTDGRDTLTASAEVAVFATADVTDGRDVGGNFQQTFEYTGAYEEYVVPTGVTSLRVRAEGGAGSGYDGGGGNTSGGKGALVDAVIPVTPGETLRVYVGGRGEDNSNGPTPGAGGFNGGGNNYSYIGAGGGGTDIRRSPYGLADRLVVAGGGGGGTGLSYSAEDNLGGDGGYPNGGGPTALQRETGDQGTGEFNDTYDLSYVTSTASSEDTAPEAVHITADGLTMYVVGDTGNAIDQYTLTRAWDLRSAYAAGKTLDVSGQDTSPHGLAVSEDGLTLILLGYNGNTLYQYTLGTAFDISTATYDTVSFNTNGQTLFPTDMHMVDGGETLYISDTNTDRALQYDLSTAWDLSTISFVGSSPSFTSIDSSMYGIAVTSDGTKMFLGGYVGDDVHRFTLSTPFDVTTATYDNYLIAVNNYGYVKGLFLSPDDTRLYVASGTNKAQINQYDLGGEILQSYAQYGYWSGMGGGGSQTEGGTEPTSVFHTGVDGSFGQGGNGGSPVGGGGGGGWYGGGSGGYFNTSDMVAAGGGSSYTQPMARHVYHTRGVAAWGDQPLGGGYLSVGPGGLVIPNGADATDGTDTVVASGTVTGRVVKVIPPSSANDFYNSGTSINVTAPTMLENDVLVVIVSNQGATSVTAPGGFGFVTLASAVTLDSSTNGAYVFAAIEDGIGTLTGASLTFSRTTGSGDIDAAWIHLRSANGDVFDWQNPIIDTIRPTRQGSVSHGTVVEYPMVPTTPASAGSVTVLATSCDSATGEMMWHTGEWVDYFRGSGGTEVPWIDYNRRLSIRHLSFPEGGTVPPPMTQWHSTTGFNLTHDQVGFAMSFGFGNELDATDGTDTVVGVGFIPPEATLAETDGIDTAVGVGLGALYEAALAESDGLDTAVGVGDVPNNGSMAATDGIDTATGSGRFLFEASLAATDGIDTAAGSGSLLFEATLAESDGIDTAAGVGLGALYEGTLAESDGIDTAVGSGTIPNLGTLAETDGIDTAVGAAWLLDKVGLLTANVTLFDTRVGVSVLPSTISTVYGTATHTVIAGTTSRTAGAAAVLDGDYAFRGLYGFDTTTISPGDFQTDARGWVQLAEWGDFQFQIRRDIATTYRIRADFVNAATDASFATGSITIPSDVPTSLGLGVTRDVTTGVIKMWVSTDGWLTWTQIPTATSTFAAGALPDSVPDPIVLLGGDLQDGPWISVFQAHWGSTDDITAVDANEVAAWNYGANIVTGVGGDFYDAIDRDTKNLWEFGSETSYVYSQRSETTDAGTTVRADFTFNAPTLNTGTAPAGTEAGFVYDLTPQWGQGPAQSQWSPRIGFTSTSQLTVNLPPGDFRPPTAYVINYNTGSGTLPSPGDTITWTGGGTGTVSTTDSGDNVTGTITIFYDAGPAPTTGVTVTSGGWSALTATSTPRVSDGTGDRYRVIVVERDGTPIIACDNAKTGPITWSLNEAESFGFQLPGVDECNEYISPTATEVQVWRGDLMLVWGVVVRSLRNGDTVDYQCRGLAWYFTKRFVGGPRQNFLGNGSFETNGFWWENRLSPTEGLPPGSGSDPSNYSGAISTDRSIAGFPGKSLRLWSNNIIEFGVMWFQFIFAEVDNVLWPDGIQWTAAAWVYIPSDEWGEFDAEAEKVVGERNAAYNWGGESAPFGLHLVRFSTTESQEQDIVDVSYPKVEEISVAGLTEDTPRDQWVRIETSLVAPAAGDGATSRTDWMQVELHCPIGTVFWDEVSLTRNDRLFYNEVAQEAILFDVVQHAQDPVFGKSDLNIGFAAAPITNINRTREYPFFNRRLISDIIDEFSTIWDGVDWSIETSPTQRLFAPWFPMKGTRRPAQALVGGRNIASLSIANDGEQLANRYVVMSDGGGTGSSREEAIGTRGEPDVVLEASINAVPESPLDSLEGQLQRALRFGKDATIPTLTTYEGVGSQLLGQVSTGDVVPVSVVYGSLALQGEYRIVALTWNPDDETMDFTLNQFDDYRDPSL